MPDRHALQKLSLQQILLGFIAVLLSIGLLKMGRTIFMPIGIGVCLSFILMPLVDKLEQWRIPRLLGSLFALGASCGFMVGLGMLLSLSLSGVSARLPHYLERARVVSLPLMPYLRRMRLGFDLDSWLTIFDRDVLASFAGSSVLWFVDFLAEGTVIFFVALFVLIEADAFRQKLRRAFGLHNAVNDSILQITQQIQRYLLTKTLISLGVGLIVWAFLGWLGVDFALIWAFLAFVLNFIPNLGAVVASVPPVLLAFLQFEDPFGYGLTVSLGLLGIHMVIGNYIDPMITGGTLNLSALAIFINLCFWGWLWGPMGMFISVPIIVACKVTMSHIPATMRYAELLDE